MKLAEALLERADLKIRIGQLVSRMTKNVKVQEGDEPAEKVTKLFAQYEENMSRLEGLITLINKTNNGTVFDGMTLAAAIAKRDCLKSKIHVHRDIYDAATVSIDRYSNNEIKFVSCVDAEKLQKKIDALSKEYRELDTKMQGLNWTVDLLE